MVNASIVKPIFPAIGVKDAKGSSYYDIISFNIK